MSNVSWYYERDGKQNGPVAAEEVQGLIESGILGQSNSVWCSSFSSWMPIKETEFAEYLVKVEPPILNLNKSVPPPLVSSSIPLNKSSILDKLIVNGVDNKWVWLLAFAPIIGMFLEIIVAAVVTDSSYEADIALASNSFWYVSLFLNILLSVVDSKMLKRAKVDTSAFGKMAFLIPVYLWSRAKHLGQSPSYLWVWFLCFIISATW